MTATSTDMSSFSSLEWSRNAIFEYYGMCQSGITKQLSRSLGMENNNNNLHPQLKGRSIRLSCIRADGRHGHLEPCQTRYRDMMSLYRYIPILNQISGTIVLQIPDIGYFPISGIPISGNTRYRESRYRECPDIGNPDIGIKIGIHRYWDQMSRYRVIEFPDIEHDVSCSQQAPGPGLGLAFRLLPPARNR